MLGFPLPFTLKYPVRVVRFTTNWERVRSLLIPCVRRSEPFTGGSPELLWVCTTAVLCAGLVGATTYALAPAAEARNYEQQRRHELRQLRREIRRDTRDYRRARRAYHREINRYPRVIPAYGVRYGNVYGAPAGFGVQLRF